MIEAVAIIVMTIATIAAAATQLAPRLAPGRLIFAVQPDRPHSFGYHMSWLAIRTRDSQRVIEALGLTDVESANWSTGLGTVYSRELADQRIFVSPPVDGWTLVVGLALPQPLGPAFIDKSMGLVCGLGDRFGEVHYYLAYEPIDFYAWARVVDGRLERAFAIGDEGALWNLGKPSKEEKQLVPAMVDLRAAKPRKGRARNQPPIQPTEAHVISLAAAWSLDPSRLAERHDAAPTLGTIGRAPRHWRAERALKRAA